MKKSRALSFLIAAAAISVTVGVSFSNCSQFKPLFDPGVSTNLPLNHPPIEPALDPGNVRVQAKLVAKDYVASLFREIFTQNPDLREIWAEDLIARWIDEKGGFWGGACNVYDTYSIRSCDLDPSNTKQPVNMGDTTVRQSYVLQLCDNFIGLDQSWANLRAKLPMGPEVQPNEGQTGIVREELIFARLWYLFYRREADQEALTLLKNMNLELETAKVSREDRLRLLSLEVCQSPGWQVL